MARSFLKILSEEQIARIDHAVMGILSGVGLDVAGEAVRTILTKAGCVGEGLRIKFPQPLVREYIRAAPRSFELTGLDPEKGVRIGDGRSHFQPMVGRLYILDFDGSRRPTSLSDLAQIVATCEEMKHYEILHGGAVMPAIAEVSPDVAHIAGFVQTLRHTGKPFKGSCRTPEIARDCCALADATARVSGRRLTLHTTCNLISPLQMSVDMTEGALTYIRSGRPVDFASEPQSGATSPVTLAGTLAQGLAESLAGIVLAQVVNPGCPVLAGTVAAAMDMRRATIALGGIEAALINAAHAQMAAYYGLASRGTGANTNAKELNFQAGYEKMMTILLPVLAGVDLLFYPGTLEHAETISLESLVLDHDLCAIALRAQEGLRTTEGILDVDLITQPGPDGTFLGLPQTAREMFTEHLIGGNWDRCDRSDWEALGSPAPRDLARKKIDEIISREVQPLPAALEKDLADLVSEISRRRGATKIMSLLWPE
jgi:trimethylamine--corrinoid protein Co-methyltransferase